MMDGAAAVIVVTNVITALVVLGGVFWGGSKLLYNVGQKVGQSESKIDKANDNIEVLFEKHNSFEANTSANFTQVIAEQARIGTSMVSMDKRVNRIEKTLNGNLAKVGSDE